MPSTQYPQVEQLGLQATPLKGKKQLLVSLFFTFWPRPIACGILVTRSGAEPMPPALESQSLNHWANREVLKQSFLDQNQVIAWYEMYTELSGKQPSHNRNNSDFNPENLVPSVQNICSEVASWLPFTLLFAFGFGVHLKTWNSTSRLETETLAKPSGWSPW